MFDHVTIRVTDADAFRRAGIAAGYRDEGTPGARPQYRVADVDAGLRFSELVGPHAGSGGDHGAFVRDPDGANVEPVDHHR